MTRIPPFYQLRPTSALRRSERDALERPTQEMGFGLIPVGQPAPDCEVPDITKEPLVEVLLERP